MGFFKTPNKGNNPVFGKLGDSSWLFATSENQRSAKNRQPLLYTVYADSKEQYYTFITPEATKVLDEYLATRKNPISESRVFDLSYTAIQKMITRLIRKSKAVPTFKTNVDSEYSRERTWLEVPLVHGFRHRWNTIMKSREGHNVSMIESMMGHSFTVNLDKYYLDPTVENLLGEYRKAIKDLTVFHSDKRTAHGKQAFTSNG